TAGAGGLKIAETFPKGRGSPHGCGLRAVFCTDAASALPEACRDKSKEPRSGDFAGRSPGVQGAAATGRPLCAPCAMIDITQTISRERNLPGINIEVVALLGAVRTRHFRLCRYFAGWRLRLTRPTGSSHRPTPRRPGPPGDDSRHRADFVPGGGCALPGLEGPLPGQHLVALASAAPPGRSDLLLSDNLQRSFTHPCVPHHRQQPEPDQAGDQRHPRLGKHPQHSDDQPHKQQR
ncbi:hypothetical protein SAMN03159441_04759, partial [Klebsiella quasipneumoniae]